MNFKQPIASNQETKNWVSKDTQIKVQVIQNFLNWVTKETQFKASNQETKNWVTKETKFKAINQETKNWVTKETQFKARNQEFSQLGKQKKKKNQETKMKIKKIETW